MGVLVQFFLLCLLYVHHSNGSPESGTSDLSRTDIFKRLENVTVPAINSLLQNTTFTQNITQIRVKNSTFDSNTSCASFGLEVEGPDFEHDPSMFIGIFTKALSFLLEAPANRLNTTLRGPLSFPNATTKSDGFASLCISPVHFEANWVLYVIFGSITAVALLVTVVLVLSLGNGAIVNFGSYKPVEDTTL